MFSGGDRTRQFYAVSYEEDDAMVRRGSAIPSDHLRSVRVPRSALAVLWKPEPLVAMLLLFVTLLFFAGQTISFAGNPAAVTTPTVIVDYAGGTQSQPLQYGTEPLLAQADFFQDTKRAFLRDKATFIEADLARMQLRYYKDGVLQLDLPIKAKGRAGSWWETPAGLYQAREKRPVHFSSFANVNLPWSIPFQGNFFIHGVPEYPDGQPVESTFSGGCIRLATEDAQLLYERAGVGTPILVHEPQLQRDHFQYEPNLPDMAAPHYLLADVDNSTVLASSDLHTKVPIASITKLMTALIAVEHINLDTRVQVRETSLVSSIIPRLQDRHTVSMYSLLQLLLMESSNEAAELIASQLGRETFIAHMNEKAAAIGLEQTTFTDASGLDSGNQSTLLDLFRLAQYIHTNRSFILQLTADQYVASAYVGNEFGDLNNFNNIATLEDFYGGKVGETNAAGKTSLTLHRFTVKGEERIVAIIVLNADHRERDVMRLHTYFTERFVR